MRTTKTETRQVQVTDTVHCNQCGEAIDPNTLKYGNVLEVMYAGGWASVLGDGDRYEFDICEPCLRLIMDGFKIRPTVNGET